MAVVAYNVITYYQLLSIETKIQLYTYDGMIVEGILKQVDVNQNMHIADGKITSYITAIAEGTRFKNLYVMGRDIACFIPSPLPSHLCLVQPPTPSPPPRRARAPRLRGLGRNRTVPYNK